MFDWIKDLWTQLFTSEKFPKEKQAVGDKSIGDVYDVDYEIDEETGEVKIIFDKK